MSEKDLDEFVEAVLSDFAKTITDDVFLRIESNREFMQRYLQMVEAHGISTTNQTIGKAIKAHFFLENVENEPDRNYSPRSKLIKSHQLLRFRNQDDLKGNAETTQG